MNLQFLAHKSFCFPLIFVTWDVILANKNKNIYDYKINIYEAPLINNYNIQQNPELNQNWHSLNDLSTCSGPYYTIAKNTHQSQQNTNYYEDFY